MMSITSPASLEQVLYDGASLTVFDSAGGDLGLAVPLGAYTVEATSYREGARRSTPTPSRWT